MHTNLVGDDFSQHIEHSEGNLNIHERFLLQIIQHCSKQALACLQN